MVLSNAVLHNVKLYYVYSTLFYYIHLYSIVSYRILSEHATLFDHILTTLFYYIVQYYIYDTAVYYTIVLFHVKIDPDVLYCRFI